MAVGSGFRGLLTKLCNRCVKCGLISGDQRSSSSQPWCSSRVSPIVCGKLDFHTTKYLGVHPKLSPQEVNTLLRANEHSQELTATGSVKSFDTNQLPSNNPIEDTLMKARCLLTTGALFGVFDGHGGNACAQVVAKRLFSYIALCLLPHDTLQQLVSDLEKDCDKLYSQELLEAFHERFELLDDLKDIYKQSFQTFAKTLVDRYNKEGGGHQKREFQMREALTTAFLRLDNDMSSEALSSHINKDTLVRLMSVAMSGAVACVVHVDGPHIHIANSGDCKAVMGVLSETNMWRAKNLTHEHNADNVSEVERILSEHPKNEHDTIIKLERLLGQLAPLRAFGDFRYKWKKDVLTKYAVPLYGEHCLPPNYYTPPYLTAAPEVIHYRLTPRDKFLVLASDGLWDLVSPLQVVRLVGEHMSGKMTLNPFRLPRKNMKINDINDMLLQRKEGLKVKPLDTNAATHLIRNALGGTEYGIDHSKLSQLLAIPSETVRLFRDDITIIVIFFNSEYLRHCPA